MNAKNARKIRKHASDIASVKDQDRCVKSLKDLCKKGVVKFKKNTNGGYK